MNSRNLLNLGLTFTLAILVTFIIYEPGKEIPAEKITLTHVTPAEINKVTIVQNHSPRIVLQKDAVQWRMTEPYLFEADNNRIQNILAISNARSHAQYSADSVNLNQLKLDAPYLTLEINGIPLMFGTTDALNGYRYIRINNTVHLITDRYSHLMTGDASILLSPALIPENAIIEKLVLPGLTLQKNQTGWQIIPDIKMSSADNIQQLLDEWRHARALRLSKAAHDNETKDVDIIKIHIGNHQSLSFAVTHTEDETILSRLDIGLRYHFTTEAGKRLLSLATKTHESSAGQ